MKVLLVGGSGILSSAVALESIKNNIEVFVINRGLRKLPEGVKLVKSDKSDYANITKQIRDEYFDAVIDFLCFTEKEIETSFNFYKNYTRQYFFISSCGVYDTRVGGIMKEDSPKVLPIWQYSVDKWASEEKLVKLAHKSKMHYTIIRPCITYDDTRIPYGITPHYGCHWTIVERIKHKKPIIRWNHGTNKASMMRVEDFAVGVVGLIGNKKAYNESFNICGDEAPTFNDVISIIENWVSAKAVFLDVPTSYYAEQVPSKRGEILGGRGIDCVCSNQKIKEAVPNFAQKILINSGVEMTLNSYQENNYHRGIEWSFDAECDRVAFSYCGENGVDSKIYNIGFVDYLHNSSWKDKLEYILEYHRNNKLIQLFMLFRRIVSKLNRICKK